MLGNFCRKIMKVIWNEVIYNNGYQYRVLTGQRGTNSPQKFSSVFRIMLYRFISVNGMDGSKRLLSGKKKLFASHCLKCDISNVRIQMFLPRLILKKY